MPPTTLTMLAPGRAPHPDEVRQLANLLASDELILLPTETVYGVAARADSRAALERLAALKGRPGTAPFSLHIGITNGANPSLKLPADLALAGIIRRLVSDFWPGPLTLILKTAAPELAQLARQGRVGLRAPSHPFTSALLAQLDFPVVLSSANPHGAAPPTDAAAALAALGERAQELAFVVDAGPTSSAQAKRASSVLVVEPGRFELTREGLLSLADVRKSAGLQVAFACTGNTCRSPMAEALGRRACELLLKAAPATFGFTFSSMGLAAYPGAPPSEHAVEVMRTRGLDISAHRSCPADPESILALDRIYTMTRAHRDGLRVAFDNLRSDSSLAPPTVELLDPDGQNISDPFGGALGDYERAASDIEAGIAARVSDWI